MCIQTKSCTHAYPCYNSYVDIRGHLREWVLFFNYWVPVIELKWLDLAVDALTLRAILLASFTEYFFPVC